MPDQDRVGQQLRSYKLLKRLGKGGFATVYLGEHIHLQSQVAIKVLNDTTLTPADQQSFLTEARVIRSFRHPHIIKVNDFDFVDTNIPYIVMEYAPNGTLQERHPKHTTVPLSHIETYVNDVADALQYAHDQSVVHCDVKPANMLIDSTNDILLSDFGIAVTGQASRNPAIIKTSAIVQGTIAYIAPERLEYGNTTPACDQYALGIVVYEWLAGVRPFEGTENQIMYKHINEAPPPLSGVYSNVTPEIEQVVMRALEKDPAQRYPSITVFANSLSQALRSAYQAVASLSSQQTQPNPSSPNNQMGQQQQNSSNPNNQAGQPQQQQNYPGGNQGPQPQPIPNQGGGNQGQQTPPGSGGGYQGAQQQNYGANQGVGPQSPPNYGGGYQGQQNYPGGNQGPQQQQNYGGNQGPQQSYANTFPGPGPIPNSGGQGFQQQMGGFQGASNWGQTPPTSGQGSIAFGPDPGQSNTATHRAGPLGQTGPIGQSANPGSSTFSGQLREQLRALFESEDSWLAYSTEFTTTLRRKGFRDLGLILNILSAVLIGIIHQSPFEAFAALFFSLGMFYLCVLFLNRISSIICGLFVALYWGYFGAVVGGGLATLFPPLGYTPVILFGLLSLCVSAFLHINYVESKNPQ